MTDVPDWAGYLEFRDAFAEATDANYFPIEWLDQRILEGNARLFRTANSAIVVELRRYPGGALDVHGLIAAGAKDEIATFLIPMAEDWARTMECTAAVIESRPGWARVLKAAGYDTHQVTVRKEL